MYDTEIIVYYYSIQAILFRGFPVDDVNQFTQCVEATGLQGMDYVGGAAVRTQLTSRVFTANESPPSEKIPFHHEMSQVPEPPTHLFFYCALPPSVGGEVQYLYITYTPSEIILIN